MKVTRTLAAWALALVVSAAQAVPVFIDPLTFSGPTLWTIQTASDGSTVVIDPTGKLIDLGVSYATAYTAWEVEIENGVTSLFVAALGSSNLFDPFTKVGQANYTGAGLSSILFEKFDFSVSNTLLNGDTQVDSPGLDVAGAHSIFGLFDDRYPGATFDFYTSGTGNARLAFEGVDVVMSPQPTSSNTPEPTSLALVGLALFAASFASRRLTA